jgi:hypothetical protein
VRGYVPGDDGRILQIARGTCTMLNGGVATSYLLRELSTQAGVSADTASRILGVAQSNACYG